MAYSVQIYTKNWKNDQSSDGTLTRTLTHTTRIRVRRPLNQAEQIMFSVPRGSDDADALEISRVVRILDGTTIVASGIIIGELDKTQSLIPVTALGKAEILNRQITPEDFQLESDDAIGQIQELLKNYRFFRINTESQFNDGTHSSTEVTTVANSINPDQDDIFITLTQNANDEYADSGTYISQPILCTDETLGDPNDITRLRYKAEVGNETDIQVSFRYSNAATTATTHTWSAWSTDYEADGQSRESLGITGYSISADFRWIQVRFQLTTTDNTITPALQAAEIICEYDGEISAGTISLEGAKYFRNPSFESHLRAIQQIVASRNAELRVNDDYELDISSRFGVTTPTVTFTVGTNCNVVKYALDDRRLSTEIWSIGATGEGLAREFKATASDSAVETYGSRPWLYSPTSETESERNQEASDELDKRKEPTKTAVIDELSATALNVSLGDLVNFVYTARGINTQLRVIEVRQADPRAGTPRQFELIADEGFFFSPEAGPAEIAESGASGAEAVVDTLSWTPLPPLSVFLDEDGNFGGVIIEDIDDYISNPSGAMLTFSIASSSNGISSASLDSNNDLTVNVTGVVGNSLNENVVVRAVGTVGGTNRIVDATINIDLVYSTASDAEAGATGTTGATGPAPTLTDTSDGVQISSGGTTLTVFDGATGVSGDDSTVAGPQGDTGADSTVAGPQGDTGADSTVAGPQGDTGADSTVAGPQGTTGATGLASTVAGPQGDTGADSTVAGPQGDTGADSTVAGPQGDTGNDGADSTVAGPQGDTGADSTVAGPQGDTGNDGDDSTVAGPQGDTGADSTVAGPQGDTGNDGDDSTVAGPQGDTGADSTVAGPQGDTGNDGDDSTVAGPQGDTGADSTVAGPQGDTGNDGDDSTVAGPQGDTGADSTVPGPQGDTGADSTVPGPQGGQGDTGADSTVAGPQGGPGDTGADSTVPGPQGGQGDTGADSTVPGPQGGQGDTGVGEQGDTGTDSTVAGPAPTLADVAGGVQISSGGTTLTIHDGDDSTVPGPKGDTGNDGADSTVPGPQGNKGDTGNDGDDSTVAGPQGNKGDTGNQGTSGISGSSVTNAQVNQAVDAFFVNNPVADGQDGGQGPKGDTGDTGADSTVAGPQGNKGDTGNDGADSTVAGPQGNKGDTGNDGADSTVAGPQGNKGDTGNDGADSTVAGPQGNKGDTGNDGDDSTVPGPQGNKGDTGNDGDDSTVPGPQGNKGDTGNDGDDSTVPGPQGNKGDTGNDGDDSTVAGPQGNKGDTGNDGADSTVPGPQGNKGDTGNDGDDSTVAGPQGNKGDTGNDGDDSTVPGPQGDTGADSTVAGPQGGQGDTGNDGADSTVPGPQGDTGNQGEQGEIGDAASLDFGTLASYFEEDPDAPAGSVAFDFNNQQILIGSSGADS